MINISSRRVWGIEHTLPDNGIGYDSYGKPILEGALVEVLEEEEMRKGGPLYKFCARGKQGTAHKHSGFPQSWFVDVTFDGETVGCTDFHVRLV